MTTEKLTFATEEAKTAALEAFDERTSTEEELDRIIEAEIVSEEPGPDDTLPADDAQPPADNLSKPDEIKKPEADTTEPEGGEKTDVETLKATIAEKEAFIRDNFSQMGAVSSLEEKIKALEDKLETRQQETVVPKKDLKASKMASLQEQRAKLLEKYPDPEDQLNGEYVKEMNEIQSGMLEEIASLNHNLEVVQDIASKATEKAETYFSKGEQKDREKTYLEQQQAEIAAVEAFANKTPEFKLSKPFNEVDEEYKDYQKTVSRAYFGREPRDTNEINIAMNQLKRRSPGLINRLKAAGLPTEPSQDVKRYLGVCETWDYWKGYRKDPLTGDFRRDKNGNILPLTRYNPLTGKEEPDEYRSIETAYNDKAAKEGFYTRQLLQAKIDAGKAAMSAVAQRDGGATELGPNETQKGPLTTPEEAFERINKIDEVLAVKMAQIGDFSLLNEYNELAKVLEWAPVDDIA